MMFLTSFKDLEQLDDPWLPVFSFTEIIFIIYTSFLIIVGFIIILSRDVIYSLLGLIFSFVLCSILILSYNLEFLSFSLIIVSLGAVSVLFLYIVFMVYLKSLRIERSLFYMFNISSFFFCLFFLVLTIWMTRADIEFCHFVYELENPLDKYGFEKLRWEDLFNLLYSMYHPPLKLYGILLYEKFFLFFVLIGVLLLAALVGCILLTYDYYYEKK